MAAMSSRLSCPGLPPKMLSGLLDASLSISPKMWRFRAFLRALVSRSILATASPLNTFSAPRTAPSTMTNTASWVVPRSQNPRSSQAQVVQPRLRRINLKRGFTSRLSGFLGLRAVVTLAVNGRYLCAHTAQVRSELAAVMNGVVQAEDRKLDRRPLEHPAKIHDLHQLLAAHVSERFEVFRVTLLVPGSNLSRRLDVFRNHRRVGV